MILILDIGKTNKKCLVFDEDYRIFIEKNTVLPETTDDDGDPCEDLTLLKNWVLDSLSEVLENSTFRIKAINATAYGASFVHLDANGAPVTPLYNYLKPYPEDLKKQFFETYGDEEKMALETASPILGHLNSGLQLYWLKHCKPLVYHKIKWSVHLPQYVAWLLKTGGNSKLTPDFSLQPVSETTSIGCHTLLWDFQKNDYHYWVHAEDITEKFPPIHQSPITNHQSPITGTGLHDSSAALLPYLATFKEPFVLISTGTWCITLNPFNDEPLTLEELSQDCLCYLTIEGKPVKAARYFGGNEHGQAVREMALEFGVREGFYRNGQLSGNPALAESYLAFMRHLVDKQTASAKLAIGKSSVQRIFVDGGFSKNELYMSLLAEAFPNMEVFAAEVAQATALGAALVLHPFWNKKPLPHQLISLKKYSRLT